MRRTISSDNPFFHQPRFAFGYSLLPDNARVLDFGCNNGEYGALLKRHRSLDYVGVDKNRDAVRESPEGIIVKELIYPLPFVDGEFDVVMMFEVLEHIVDQNQALQEV